MKKALSAFQQKVVNLMREGWVLSPFGARYFLCRMVGGEVAESLTVPYPTVQALVEKCVIFRPEHSKSYALVNREGDDEMIAALTKLLEGCREFDAAFDQREQAENFESRKEAVNIKHSLNSLESSCQSLKERLLRMGVAK
jgi:hypothetical protein